jgi:gliding motility associated protien GldN
MKKILLISGIALMLTVQAVGQTVREKKADDFHVSQPVGKAKPIPFPFLREEDVVWSTTLWKNIDCNELFNQFFYFPSDEYINFGKKSLAYIIWDAMVANEIPIYEDDELKVPLDNEIFFKRYTRPDTILLEIGYDEDDNEMYETVIKPRYFDGSEVFGYSLREVWFIGRQDTRQDSRRIALAPLKESYRVVGGGVPDIYLGRLPIFWIPMQNPRVRKLLVNQTAYISPQNIVNQPSWDWVFLNQHYTAYTTRESNMRDMSIRDYVTGNNAILEAELIEEKVYEIENEMWEY